MGSRDSGQAHIAYQLPLDQIGLADDEILFTNGPGLQGQIDRAFAEIMENDRNTAPYPVSMSVKFGSCPRPISWQETRNIITTSGLEEMAERSTGESSTANTHHAIGTGTVAEALADTALGTEVARKELGSAARNGTTEKYSTAFGSGDISVTLPVDITEAGIFTSSSGGVCVVRETSDGQAIASGNTLVATVDIAHVNGTEA